MRGYSATLSASVSAMPPNEKTMLAKARQLNREVGPILLTIEGDPEVRKLQY